MNRNIAKQINLQNNLIYIFKGSDHTFDKQKKQKIEQERKKMFTKCGAGVL